ncbi:putative cinnamyl alcohol dehydrogenase 6 [Capsicum chinense]|nr:putative cinnamyl alcohol dehydrogenase 6 [Capsicum chinense]
MDREPKTGMDLALIPESRMDLGPNSTPKASSRGEDYPSHISKLQVHSPTNVGLLPTQTASAQLPLTAIGDNLPLDGAAPLLGAGITVYTPMKDSYLLETSGKRTGVAGLGGLGHLAIKFGKAYGHHVTMLSTSPSKEKDAKELLGADDFVLTSNEDEMKVISVSSLS